MVVSPFITTGTDCLIDAHFGHLAFYCRNLSRQDGALLDFKSSANKNSRQYYCAI